MFEITILSLFPHTFPIHVVRTESALGYGFISGDLKPVHVRARTRWKPRRVPARVLLHLSPLALGVSKGLLRHRQFAALPQHRRERPFSTVVSFVRRIQVSFNARIQKGFYCPKERLTKEHLVWCWDLVGSEWGLMGSGWVWWDLLRFKGS